MFMVFAFNFLINWLLCLCSVATAEFDAGSTECHTDSFEAVNLFCKCGSMSVMFLYSLFSFKCFILCQNSLGTVLSLLSCIV